MLVAEVEHGGRFGKNCRDSDVQQSKMTGLRPPTLTVLAAGALVLAACGEIGADTATRGVVAPTVAAQANESSQAAADFEFSAYQGAEKLGGETVRFSEILNLGRPVVLNFWAGLCPPCRLEMPDFQEVYEQFDGQFILVGVDVGPFTALGSREDGRALLEHLGVSYPAGTTFDPAVLQDYSVLGMPSTAFITPQGEIVSTWTGLLTKAKMTELVEELLQASAQ